MLHLQKTYKHSYTAITILLLNFLRVSEANNSIFTTTWEAKIFKSLKVVSKLNSSKNTTTDNITAI